MNKILTGLIIILSGIGIVSLALYGCIIIAGLSDPKSFDSRVIDNEDGTYTTQYYIDFPEYRDDPNGYRVSLEKAKERAESWNRIRENRGPVVVK